MSWLLFTGWPRNAHLFLPNNVLGLKFKKGHARLLWLWYSTYSGTRRFGFGDLPAFTNEAVT